MVQEHFWNMKVRRSLYLGHHTVLNGYDHTAMRPKQQQFGRATSVELVMGYPFEYYDYPGGFLDPEKAGYLAAGNSFEVRGYDEVGPP